jgi:hypothetical protein
MKKLLLLMVLWCGAIHADTYDWCRGWEAEVRVAGFRPASKLFREIYSSWGTSYQLEGAKQICGAYYGWANVEWYKKEGHSIPLRDKTDIKLIPFSFGLKYVYWINSCLNAYLGIGPSFTWVKVHNHSDFVKRHVTKESYGGVVKLGVHYYFWCNAFLNLFADYNYQPIHFCGHNGNSGHHVNLGGWKIGGGIGLSF